MNWRPSKSIDRLSDEVKTAYPGTIVWTIGDEDHQSGWSDHNPNECCDVVCAADVKGNAGLDLADFVRHLITHPHPNLRYVIYRRKIYQRKNNFEPEDYHGSNPHDEHAHVSTGNGPDGRSTRDYDSTASWRIADIEDGAPPPAKPSKPSTGTKLGDKMPTIERGNKGSRVRMLQGLLIAWGHKISVDGVFGPKTEAAVRSFQGKYAKPVDGIVGPITWNKLLGL
jgi:hypothetical protein